MVVHTSHYAAVGAVISEVASSVLTVACGAPIDAATLANPLTVSLAAVAVIDVLARHLKELSIAKINGGTAPATP